MKKKIRMALCGATFLLPSLLGVLLFFIVPFGINIVYSFSSSVTSFDFVGFFNYSTLFASDAFQLSLRNTTVFLVIGVLSLLFLANVLALFLDFSIKRKLYFAEVALMGSVVPMIIPTGSVLVFFKKLFENTSEVAWTTSSAAFLMLLILFLWKNVGYCMLVIFTGIHTIPKEMLEAAKIDGAGSFRIFQYIIFPQIRSFLCFAVIMGIIGSFKMYRESYLLFGEYPHESIYMLQNFLNNNFYSINYQKLTTASIVFTVCLSTLLILTFVGGNQHEG